MSDDELSKKDKEALKRLATQVMHQLAAGRPAKDIARELNANGWPQKDADEFVADLQKQWREVEHSPDARTALYLQARFPDMRPVDSAPSLATVNGIGTGLYGARDHDPDTDSYVKTHCVCVLFIPVIALGSYRVVKASGSGWHMLGKVPLSGFAKAWNMLLAFAAVVLVAYGGWSIYTGSENYQAGKKLARADEAAEAGDLVEAAGLYSEVARTHTNHRNAARERLEGLAQRPELDKMPVEEATRLFRHIDVGLGAGQPRPAVFARGLALVKRHAPAAPRQAAVLLQTIAAFSRPEACQAVADLSGGPFRNLSAEDTLEVFRTVSDIPQQDGPKQPIARCGIDHANRLAAADLPAAVELLGVIAPLSEPDPLEDCLQSLLGNPLERADCPAVCKTLEIALGIDGPDRETTVVERGLSWLEGHPKTDPRQALALLDVLPKSPEADADRIAAAQRGQLERLVAADPADVGAAVRLALVLETEGDLERIETLLTPLRDKLGTGEGARLLGQRLAATGRFDEAYALLAPYLDQRLGNYHQAEQEFSDAMERAANRVLQQLEEGNAPGFNYNRARRADKSAQQAMVDDYITQRLKNDTEVARARERLAEHATVVPAALDLGMVLLHRARDREDAESRKNELKRAEKTFLAVQGMAGETDQYRLNLGQVYYWLGKNEEGRREFDQLLASNHRQYEMLVAVAHVLRELGSMGEARRLAEEAYGKTSDPRQKHAAAYLRAITEKDLDDRLLWLDRCDPSTSEIKTELARARGDRAARQGQYDEAARHYREAIALYQRQTETTFVLNDGALVYLALFEVTGDREALDRCVAWIEKAVALSPGDAISLGNAAYVLLRTALQDLAGNELDLRELDSGGSISALYYLAGDAKALEDLRERVRNHAVLKKALAYFGQAMVLEPKNPRSYAAELRIYSFNRDRDALRRLRDRAAEAELDLEQRHAHLLEFYRYEDDESDRQGRDAAMARAEALVKQYARGPKGPALAAAVGRLVSQKVAVADESSDDADRLVQLAEQAHQAAPSLATYSTLIEALMFRAHWTLARAHPGYASATQRTGRSVSPSYSVVLALERSDALGQAARDNPDVRRAADLALERIEAFPDETGAWTWALLRATHPDRASALADKLTHDPVDQLQREITQVLVPFNAATACEQYWARQAAGNHQNAREPLEALAQRKVPFPTALLPPENE